MRKAMVGALAMMLVAVGMPALAQAPEAAVGETFVAARSALMNRDGAAVLELLSRDSRQRVERARAAAVAGTPAALYGLAPSEKFAALGLQRYLKPAELKRMNAAQLVEYALNKGWLGPNLIAGAGLDKVSVRGDRATGLLMVDQRPAMLPAEFVREEGGWRIDLARALEFSDALVRGTALATKRSEDDIVRELLDRAAQGKAQAANRPRSQ